jgi:trans-aconitate methyltransferase
MNRFSFSTSHNLFNHPPVAFEDFDAAYDYDTMFGAEKYAYNTYRHYIIPYLNDARNKTIFDINCGKGYGLATLKAHYGFKKAIGYNDVPELLDACKKRHSNVRFYKDFIMSKQKDADYIFSFNAFDNYDNKSALLLRMRQALAPNGHLIIVQSTDNQKELNNHFTTLEKTHGLKSLYQSNITDVVFTAVERISEQNEFLCANYASYQSNRNYNADYRIIVKVFQNV